MLDHSLVKVLKPQLWFPCEMSGNETIQTFTLAIEIDGKMALCQYFKSVDGQYLGYKLLYTQGVLSKEVLLGAISAANTEVAVLPSSSGMKVSGTYMKGSAEKAETGKRAAEHRVLATVRYYDARFLIQLAFSTPCPQTHMVY